MGFLESRQEPGVYSRGTAGMSIRNSKFKKDGVATCLACNTCLIDVFFS